MNVRLIREDGTITIVPEASSIITHDGVVALKRAERWSFYLHVTRVLVGRC